MGHGIASDNRGAKRPLGIDYGKLSPPLGTPISMPSQGKGSTALLGKFSPVLPSLHGPSDGRLSQ